MSTNLLIDLDAQDDTTCFRPPHPQAIPESDSPTKNLDTTGTNVHFGDMPRVEEIDMLSKSSDRDALLEHQYDNPSVGFKSGHDHSHGGHGHSHTGSIGSASDLGNGKLILELLLIT